METVILLSLKSGIPKTEVTMEVDSESNYSPVEKATLRSMLRISQFICKDIAEVKRMCGINMGENYNKSNKENPA